MQRVRGGSQPAATSGSLLRRLGALARFDIWRVELRRASMFTRACVTTARLCAVVAAGIREHQITSRAAALAFTTVFGLIPTLAVGFAMFQAFGGLEDAKSILLPRVVDYLAVGIREQVIERVDAMLDTIHGGAIGAVGSLFLFAAVVSLLSSIEDAFNQIWGVKQARGLVRRVTGYWAVVTVTPVLLIAGLSLPAMLQRVEPIEWSLAQAPWLAMLVARVLPLVLICGGFSLLYGSLTAARVPIRAALAGGCVGGSCWLAAVSAYASYAGQSDFYTTVYGPLAAIPVFLFWLYLSWVIVLLGALVAFATENVDTYRDAMLARDVTPAERELLALGILAAVAARFADGAPAPNRQELRRSLRASLRMINQTIEHLCAAGFLVEVDANEAVAPAHDPRQMKVADVVATLRGERGHQSSQNEALAPLAALRAHADSATRQAWGDVSCHDLGQHLAPARDRAD